MILIAIVALLNPLMGRYECASPEIDASSLSSTTNSLSAPISADFSQPAPVNFDFNSPDKSELGGISPDVKAVSLTRAAAESPSPPAPIGFDILQPSVVKSKRHVRKPPAKPVPRFSFSGVLFERYRNDYNRNNGSISSPGDVTYGAITGKYQIINDYWAYLRIAGEGVSQGGQGRDFNTDYYTGTHGYRGALAFDQFGLDYDNVRQGTHVTLGRQGKSLDATSTIYDQSWRVGNRSFLDGVSASKRYEKWAFELDAFSEDQYVTNGVNSSNATNGLYAVRTALELTSKLVAGATLAKFIASSASSESGNQTDTSAETDLIWEASNNVECRIEYGKSDASSRNELYFASAIYHFTKRDSITALAYKIGEFADLGGESAYPNNNRGARYFIQHNLSNRTSIIFYHETDHELYGPGVSGSDQITLSYAF
jgi:hypothetical protein